MPEMKSDKEIRQSIVDIAGLYKVKEIQLADLKSNQWVDLDLSGGILRTDRTILLYVQTSVTRMLSVRFFRNHFIFNPVKPY